MSSVIYVEDEIALREDVAEELTDAGYTVYQAGDGVEGLDEILKHRPDLILSDITMPRMNGHELLLQVRKHPGFEIVPFLFVSALCDHKDMLEGVRLGADDYMTKPIDYDILLLKVELALKRVERLRRQQKGILPEVGTNPILDHDIGWR